MRPNPDNNPDYNLQPGGRHHENRLVPANPPPVHGMPYFGGPVLEARPVSSSAGFDIKRLLRKYLWLALACAVLGVAAGFASIVLQPAVYKSRALLEVQSGAEGLGQRGGDANSQMDLQTHVQLLYVPTFLNQVVARLQAESVPPAPAFSDFFHRMRSRLRTESRDPIAVMKEGLEVATLTFQARPINGTRIIEIGCDSTNPEIAAAFVNTVATAYIEQNLQSRSQVAQTTNQWLGGQLEETRAKLAEGEQRLQGFVRSSGNIFVSDADTLAQTKLKQLQNEVSSAQSDRISRQARYETLAKTAPDDLPRLIDTEVMRLANNRAQELRREIAVLTTTRTSDHYKVKALQAELEEILQSIRREAARVVEQSRTEYEAALRRERSLGSAYSAQSVQVSSQAGNAAQYAALKREVDTLRETYSSMLLQVNQAGVATSAPLNNLRVVEQGAPAPIPYKPRPALNLAFGVFAGIALCVGIAFLRERADSSLRDPAAVSSLLNVPELGVIPSAAPTQRWSFRSRGGENVSRELAGWQEGGSLLTDSFRITLTALLRETAPGRRPKLIVLTSPGPGEGKTTLASNLAVAVAESGRSVVLVDADFRRPRLHDIFGVSNEVGLSGLLANENAPGTALIETNFPHLSLLPAGPPISNIARALHSPRLHEILDQLRREHHTVLVDAPPILQFADAQLLSRISDGAVLVIRSGMTSQTEALEAHRRLVIDGTVLLGTVLNDCPLARNESKRYQGYYADRA